VRQRRTPPLVSLLVGWLVGRSAYSSLMMEAVRASEKSVDNHFTRQYNPEDSSEHHTRRRENLKSHKIIAVCTENHTRLIHTKCTFNDW
jgi:hypothetical protein